MERVKVDVRITGADTVSDAEHALQPCDGHLSNCGNASRPCKARCLTGETACSPRPERRRMHEKKSPPNAISFRLGGAAEGGASACRHKIRARHGAAAPGEGAAVFFRLAGPALHGAGVNFAL